MLVEPGQWVAAGQTLAVINRSVQAQEASQLAAQIEVTRADLRLAQNELDRAQALVGRGFVSQADHRPQARRPRRRRGAGPRRPGARSAPPAPESAGSTCALPTAGLVLVALGRSRPGGRRRLAALCSGSPPAARWSCSPACRSPISPGSASACRSTVTPVGSTQTYQGSVWQVSPIIDPQTRQGVARIAVPYNRELRPGGFASAEIRAGSTTAPLLPESAVQSDQRGNFVYIVDNQNKVVRRDVRIGEVSDRGMAIVSGLNGNERVVLSAGAFLSPGQQVRPELRRRAQ